MGLLMNAEGRPVGFDLYPGNTFEGNTVEAALDKLKTRFQINKVIWVSDRGFCSEKTFQALKDKGYEYIIGAKLKNMSAAITEQVLDLDGYETLEKCEEEEILIRYKVLEAKKTEKAESTKLDRILCTWSRKRAEKDKADRNRAVRKAEALLEAPSKLNGKRGTRKYLKITTQAQGLDEERIKAEARWDGIYGIRTNNPDMLPTEILDAYHQLWRIEECFRVLKTNLETRPVFHWTPKRIQGHFVLCFIAFLLERTLELMLKEEKIDYSVSKLRDSITALELSVLKIKDKQYYLRANPDKLGGNILKILKISKPKHFEAFVV